MFKYFVYFAVGLILASADVSTSDEQTELNEDEKPTLGETVTVKLDQGQLRGYRNNSTRGHLFYSFLGIPYAAPPVGKLRFKDPEQVASWEGVLDGGNQPPVCPQVGVEDLIKDQDLTYRGQEDCLYLNIYTPRPNEMTSRLPVMVYIHGGHFISGEAPQSPPLDLLDLPVVFVALQYRLGVLGFLSTEDTVIPGNLGLKDLTMALSWVQYNIDKFGGNRNSVTLFGSGSGAALIHYLMLSHHTIGLFHRAILQSGNALCPWASGKRLRDTALSLGDHFQCFDNEPNDDYELVNEENPDKYDKKENVITQDGMEERKNKNEESEENNTIEETEDNNDKEEEEKRKKEEEENKRKREDRKSRKLLECLQDIDSKDLTEFVKSTYVWSLFPTIFAPYFDDDFFPGSPENLLQNGRHKRLHLIMGTNQQDGAHITKSIFSNKKHLDALNNNFEEIGPISLGFSSSEERQFNLSVKAYAKYMEGLHFSSNNAAELTKLYTDRHYTMCSQLTADWHYENNKLHKKNIYFYELINKMRSTEDSTMSTDDVTLGDELDFLFSPSDPRSSEVTDDDVTTDDVMTKHLMVDMWYNFAAFGYPTPKGLFNFTWKPYTKTGRKYLKIGPKPELWKNYKRQIGEFWNALPTSQNRILNKHYFEEQLKEEEEAKMEDNKKIIDKEDIGEYEKKKAAKDEL